VCSADILTVLGANSPPLSDQTRRSSHPERSPTVHIKRTVRTKRQHHRPDYLKGAISLVAAQFEIYTA
jgi:hypothetical protein